MVELLRDLWGYLSERKKYWLLPIVTVLVLLGALIVIAQQSSLSAFLYTLF